MQGRGRKTMWRRWTRGVGGWGEVTGWEARWRRREAEGDLCKRGEVAGVDGDTDGRRCSVQTLAMEVMVHRRGEDELARGSSWMWTGTMLQVCPRGGRARRRLARWRKAEAEAW